MLVIEYLKRYSDLIAARVAGEFGVEEARKLTAVYGETKAGQATLDLDYTGEDGQEYGLTLTMQHPLTAECRHEYFPEVQPNEWDAFMGRA